MDIKINGYTQKTGMPTVYPISAGVTTIVNENGHCVFLADASGGIINLNLPLVANNTDLFVIKKTDSTTNFVKIQVAFGSGELIDGSSSSVGIIKQYESVTIVSDGSNWYVI